MLALAPARVDKGFFAYDPSSGKQKLPRYMYSEGATADHEVIARTLHPRRDAPPPALPAPPPAPPSAPSAATAVSLRGGGAADDADDDGLAGHLFGG